MMVRRLKADLRRLGEAFPGAQGRGDPDRGPAGRCAGARSLAPARRLRRAAQNAASRSCRRKRRRWRSSPSSDCSSACCPRSRPFARTLKAHRKTLQRLLDGEAGARRSTAAAQAFVDGSTTDKAEDLELEDEGAEAALEADEEAPPRPPRSSAPPMRPQPICAGNWPPSTRCWPSPSAAALKAGCAGALARALDQGQFACPARHWNDRRLIIFTEWEDTRRWLERRLREAIG